MIPLNGILLSARHAARSCMRGKRLFALLALVSLPLLLTTATRIFESETMSANEFHGVVLMLMFLFTVPFSALLLGVGVLGDELEGRTVTYLWTRPVGRGWTYLGRYLGSGFGYAVLFVPAMFIALHMQTPAEALGDVSLLRPIAIGLGGFFVYLALFALLRTLLKKALVAGMFYTLVVDLAVSRMPADGRALQRVRDGRCPGHGAAGADDRAGRDVHHECRRARLHRPVRAAARHVDGAHPRVPGRRRGCVNCYPRRV